MRRFFIPALFITITVVVAACTSGQELSRSDAPVDPRAKELLAQIDVHNSATPDFIKAYVSVNGSFKERDFKADGVAYVQNEPQKAKIILNDLIFKSPVMYIGADEKQVQTYFPVEKVALISKGNYTKVNSSKNPDSRQLLAYSLSAKIPLIDNYQVKSYQKSEGGETIILYNSDFVETIRFKNGFIKVVDIHSSKKSWIYTIKYGAKMQVGEYTFFRTIRASSTDERLTIYYGKILVNPKLKKKPNLNVVIPKGTKIYK